MMKQLDTYDTQRVHKVNVVLLITLIFLLVIPIVYERGFYDRKGIVIAGLFVFLLTFINCLLEIEEDLKGLILSVVAKIIIIALVFIDEVALNTHFLIFLSIAIVTLYFKKELILVFIILINI